MRDQLESERRRGEAELRGEIRKEMDKLREEVAEVQVNVTLMIVMVMMVMMVMMTMMVMMVMMMLTVGKISVVRSASEAFKTV